MQKRYKYLFFDLDRTFWDVDQNQMDAQKQMYSLFEMDRHFPTFEVYFDAFKTINEKLWTDYRDGYVTREQLRNDRYIKLLNSAGVDDIEKAMNMSDKYLLISPTFNALLPHSVETLDYLKSEGYPMALITNGFNEVQFDKVKMAGLEGYFDRITTSEYAGVNKPAPGIFEYAMRKAGVKASEAVMIGDDPYSDIYGASSVGLDTIYLNTHAVTHDLNPTHEINLLIELKNIL